MEQRDRTAVLNDPLASTGRPRDPSAGDVELGSLGNYQLVRRLATGGMGEVYLAAVHGEAGFVKPVVIKRLHPNLGTDDEFVQMLIDEARITSQLIHTNICQVMDLGMDEEDYFIAMEYIHGLDLSTLGRRAGGSFDLDAAIFIASETLAGLHYAHHRSDPDGQPFNIVHRDISPQNILVSFEGEVKIIDFGIAKARNRLVQTGTGVIKGKYLYMAPEQALGKGVDPRTDLYSAAVVLYELLRGQSPLAGLPHVEMLRRICDPEFEPLHRHRSDVPRGLMRVLRKALKRDPADRYDSAQAFQAALQPWGGRYSRTDLADYVRGLFPEHANSSSRPGLPVTEVDQHCETVTDAPPSDVGSRQAHHDTRPARWTHATEEHRRSRRESRQEPRHSLARPDIEARLAHDVVEPPLLPKRDPRPSDQDLEERRSSGSSSKVLVLVVVCVALLGVGLLIGQIVDLPEASPPAQLASRGATRVDAAAVDAAGVDAARGVARPRKRRWRTIAVRSRPRGARVKLCGRLLRQTTPAWVRMRVGRRCALELELDGYQTFRTVVRGGRRAPAVEVKLERLTSAPAVVRTGRLRIVSVHEAVVYVNGKEAGLAPGFDRKFPAGRYRVRVFFTALERYSSTRIVTVKGGETTSARFGP